MAEHILKCEACSRYTMDKICPSCGSQTREPKPPKFSLQDKYAVYRREEKKKWLKEKGLF